MKIKIKELILSLDIVVEMTMVYRRALYKVYNSVVYNDKYKRITTASC